MSSHKKSKNYVIEKILDKRKTKNNGYEYLIKWKDLSNEENTWEPYEHFDENSRKLIHKFDKEFMIKYNNNNNKKSNNSNVKIKKMYSNNYFKEKIELNKKNFINKSNKNLFYEINNINNNFNRSNKNKSFNKKQNNNNNNKSISNKNNIHTINKKIKYLNINSNIFPKNMKQNQENIIYNIIVQNKNNYYNNKIKDEISSTKSTFISKI
jgi:hypothetical protein